MAGTGSDASDADCRPRPPISFELFPPRTDAAALALGRTIDRLAEADPAFISVTFGAGGSSRDRSLTVLRYILENTDVEPMAHLTCVGSSHAEANRLVREFLDAGITSFLALRGDPPDGATTPMPASATSAVRPNSCNSSTEYRRSASRSPRRACPACPAPRASASDDGPSGSPSRPSPRDIRVLMA